jgi:hypothetical protein
MPKLEWVIKTHNIAEIMGDANSSLSQTLTAMTRFYLSNPEYMSDPGYPSSDLFQRMCDLKYSLRKNLVQIGCNKEEQDILIPGLEEFLRLEVLLRLRFRGMSQS